MRRQRNTLWTKEQDKNPQDQINEEEIGKISEKEFRVMIVKMIQNLRNRMEKIQETFNKDLEELKSKQTVMNNTITEIKNALEGASLVVRRLRVCLPMQGPRVQALVWEDPTCRRATGPVSHNC